MNKGMISKMKWWLVFLLLILLSGTAGAASVGNLNDQILWKENAEGELRWGGLLVSLEADYQEFGFPEQLYRQVEIDDLEEERHYAEYRKADIGISYAGIKIGTRIGKSFMIFGTAGSTKTTLEYSFSDEMAYHKDTYSLETEFESDVEMSWGGGISCFFARIPLENNRHFLLGMDLKYRYLQLSDSVVPESDGTAVYEGDFHEMQMAIEASLGPIKWQPHKWVRLNLTPYIAFKVVNLIGNEKLSENYVEEVDDEDVERYVEYDVDIKSAENLDLVAGVTLAIGRSASVTVEYRMGDEDGVGLQIGCGF